MAGWCISCSLKGWQDKHHSIAKTTVEDRGIDHAKVATNPAEAWQPRHASLHGPSRNMGWDWIQFRTIKSERREQSRDYEFFSGVSGVALLVWFVQDFLFDLDSPVKDESQTSSPVHGTFSKIQLWNMSLPPQQDLDSYMRHPEPQRACLFCSRHEPCSNSLQIGHLLLTG